MSQFVIFDQQLISEREHWLARLKRDFEDSGLRLDRPRPVADLVLFSHLQFSHSFSQSWKEKYGIVAKA